MIVCASMGGAWEPNRVEAAVRSATALVPRTLRQHSIMRPTQAKMQVGYAMHRSSIAVIGASAAHYALIKLIPAGGVISSKPLGLNLALVLDVSGSMYEE